MVAPQWVISAAHFAFKPDGEPIDAMVTVTGVADLDATGEAIAADRLVVHPRWDPDALTGDALLIHLRSPSSRPPLAVAEPGDSYGMVPGRPNAAGWGAVDVAGTLSTSLLQEAYLAVQAAQRCADGFASHRSRDADVRRHPSNVAGACVGDGGGPLVAFDRATGAPALLGVGQLGPADSGSACPICSLQAPAVYTRVAAFSVMDRSDRH